MKSIDLAILAAVPDEITSLAGAMNSVGRLEIAGNLFLLHEIHDICLLTGTTGIGKVNAAAVTAAILTRCGSVEVWNIGCAGAYNESGLRAGDVLITRDSICGDEGVLQNDGRTSMESIGIPLLTREGRHFFERFPSGAFRPCTIAATPIVPGRYAVAADSKGIEAENPLKCPEPVCFTLTYGPVLTVGMASGDPVVAAERFLAHGAWAENMEGSAVAQVCLRFGAPFLECRGISNLAGDRDKSKWDMRKAVTNCHAVVRHLLNG